MSVEYVSIDSIMGAPYNPRKINDEQFSELKKFIQKVGFVVPIIVNRKNHTIIAGHQRTKSARAIGIETLPVIYVDDVSLGDEIKFNQMHNGTEDRKRAIIKLNTEHEKEKFITIKPSEFEIEYDNTSKPFVNEICKLIVKYGNVLSSVVCNKKVVFSCEYVYACKLLNIDVNCYICDDEKEESINYYFNQDYGQYSYEDIDKTTYVQGLAQMFRMAEPQQGSTKKRNKSVLYETMVIPYIQNHNVKTILDFGCGKGAYINMLSKKYDAIGVEFYNNNGKDIIVSKGNNMIDKLIAYLNTNKTFDIVVCDSVLNSVDSVKAEKSVMACLNLFTKDIAFISGRPNKYDAVQNANKQGSFKKNRVYFLDENGFTGNYREGKWYFQKFHTPQQIEKLFEENGFKIKKLVYGDNSWQVECQKVRNLTFKEYIEAIDFEFNLILPNGKSYNRHEEVKKVLGLI